MLLSLQQFKINPSTAVDRLDEAARRLRDVLPEEERAIITEDAFETLRRSPEVVAQFPSEIASLFTDYDSFPIFSIVRSSQVPAHVVAAYMVRADKYASFAPAPVEGRLLPIDEAAIYVGDHSMCTSDVMAELREMRVKFRALKRRTDSKLQQLALRHQAATQAAADAVADKLREADDANQTARHLLNALRSSTPLFPDAQDREEASRHTAAVVALANVIHQCMVSREPPMGSTFYANIPMGSLELALPTSADEVITMQQRRDLTEALGGYTFHNLVGRRWLLLQLPPGELLEYSDDVDDQLTAFYGAMPPKMQSLLAATFLETFPRGFIFKLAGGGDAPLRNTEIQRLLHQAVVDYATLPLTIRAGLDVVRRWWSMKLADLFDLTTLKNVRDSLEGVETYKRVVNGLDGDVPYQAYKELFLDDVSFETTVGRLFTRLNAMSAQSRASTSTTFLSPGSLANYLRTAGDYNDVQRGIFVKYLSEAIAAIETTGALPTVNAVRTDIRSILSLARRHPQAIDVLLTSQEDDVNIAGIGVGDDSVLTALGVSKTQQVIVFLPIWQELTPSVPVLEALYRYFARLRLYYAVAAATEVPELVGNRYSGVIEQMRDERGVLRKFSDAFEGSRGVEWDAPDFDDAMKNLQQSDAKYMRPALSAFQRPYIRTDLSKTAATLGGALNLTPIVTKFSSAMTISDPKARRQALCEQIFDLLDLLLGGFVSPTGEQQLGELAVYKTNTETFFSLYALCLLVYISASQPPNYQNMTTFDLWRYTVDHFDNYTATQSSVEARAFRSYPERKRALPPLTIEPLPPPQLAGTTMAQRVIPFLTSSKAKWRSFDDIVYGMKSKYFAALKSDIYARIDNTVKTLMWNWLQPDSYLQAPCLITDADRQLWITAKRAIFSLSDLNVAASLYYATFCIIANVVDDSDTVNKLYVESVQQKMNDGTSGWSGVVSPLAGTLRLSQSMLGGKLWSPKYLDEILDNSNAPVLQKTPSDARTYLEMASVHAWHHTQQTYVAMLVTRYTLMGELMTTGPAGLVQNVRAVCKRLADPFTTLFPLADVLNQFTQAFVDVPSDASLLLTSLSNLIGRSNLSIDSLLTFMFFVLMCHEHNIKTTSDYQTFVNTLNADASNLEDNSIRALIVSMGFFLSDANRLATFGLVSELSGSTPRIDALVQVIDSLINKVVSALFPEDLGVVEEPTADKDIDAALDTIMKVCYRVLAQKYQSRKMHVAHEHIVREAFDISLRAIFGSDETRTTFVKNISALRAAENYEAATKSWNLFLELDQATLQTLTPTGNWRAPIDELCRAFLTVARYASSMVQLQRVTLKQIVREMYSQQRLSPKMVLLDFINPNQFDVLCATLATFPTVQRPPQYASEDLPDSLQYLVQVNAKLSRKLTHTTSWRYYFVIPPILYAIHAFELFRGVNPVSYDEGWRRICFQQLRADSSQLDELNRVIDAIPPDFKLEELYNVLIGATKAVVRDKPRDHPVHVLWDETLKTLSTQLQEEPTRHGLRVECEERTKRRANVQTYSIVAESAQVVADWIKQRFKITLVDQLKPQEATLAEEVADNWQYRVSVAENKYLLSFGPHVALATLLVPQK